MRALRLALMPLSMLGAFPAHAGETETAALFDRIAGQPPRLRIFLQAMPKGGDLHNHLWGQPYAEQLIGWAGDRGLCVSRKTLSIVQGPCKAPETEPAKDVGRRDEKLYSDLIESLSNRGRNQGLGVNDTSGHDDFFDTFDRFFPSAVSSAGPMLASARTSAAANHVSYLELMQNPAASDRAGRLALAAPWSAGDYGAKLNALSAALPALVDQAVAETDAMEKEAAASLGCAGAAPPDACQVMVRYQGFALRSQPPAYVFGQLALAFALAERDPRYVSVNIVAPEDGAVAIADFDQHMAMYRFFHARYPKVKLSLHAGELDFGLVPPADLADHIRQSVEIAGASRIGHGVDIAYETDAPGLLAEMAGRRVAVEINLTSNDTILGVKGARHPLALYRAAGVPVVLSTDDEGVSRSDMTNEYLRAATEQGLGYRDLKAMARASLEYAFLPGDSLWADGRIGTRIPACTAATPGPSCEAVITASEKARAQWRLETEFAAFERRITTLRF
ncbi:MAG: adenosine deaminase [Sphingobium sp.]